MNTIGRKKLLSLHGCLCTFKALLKMDAGIENDISVHTFEAFSILLTNTAFAAGQSKSTCCQSALDYMASNTMMPAPNVSTNPTNNIHNNTSTQKISFDGRASLHYTMLTCPETILS